MDTFIKYATIAFMVLSPGILADMVRHDVVSYEWLYPLGLVIGYLGTAIFADGILKSEAKKMPGIHDLPIEFMTWVQIGVAGGMALIVIQAFATGAILSLW